MRLTLRTLLAYLDDVLEPNAAREIGAKLGESPVAAGLVERIRDVLKRRRIGTPDVEGPGSRPEANLVAEYLDNTLLGRDVEDIERICLDSDVHLAEVAACHKILTLVLGEPVEIQRETRERMYALGAVMPSEQAGSMAGNGQTPAITSSRLQPEPTKLPEELAHPRSTGTFWVIALLLIVFGAWIGLVINDHGLFQFGDEVDGDAIAVNDGNVPGPVDIGDDDQHVPAVIDEDADVDAPTDVVDDIPPMVETDDATVSEPLLSDDAINPPPPDDMPEEDTMPPTDVVAVVPDDAVTIVPEVDETAPIMPPIVEDDQPVGAGPSMQILYTSHEDVLLHQMEEPMGWFLLPRNSVIRDGQSIACPEPFEADLLVSGAMCRIELASGTRLRSLGANAAGPFGFEIERGGLVIRHTGMPDDPAAGLGILVEGELLDVELAPGSILAVYVEQLPAEGQPEEGAVPIPATRVTMFIPQGHCVLASTSTGASIDFTPDVNGWMTFTMPVVELNPEVLQSVPGWYRTMSADRTGAARQTARRYEAMFLVDQPVETTIPTIIRHDEPRFAEYAVRTLGLIGDHLKIVGALDTGKENAIVSASQELAAWLPRDPENAERLHEELAKNFRQMRDVEIIEELLWGYQAADVRRPDVSQKLVELMLHPHPAIRVLSFEYVRRFTGLTQNYHPMNPTRQLEASVNNWREYLRRNGGALLGPEA